MGFMKQIKRTIMGEEHTEQKIGSQPVKSSAKTLADYARRGAEDIKNDLGLLQFSNYNHRISEEKMDIYRKTVNLLSNQLEHAPAMAMDTREIDEKLRKMIPLFQQAISSGYEKTASDICKMLKDGIIEDRADIHTFDEVDKEWQLAQRAGKIDKQLVMLQYRLKEDELKDNIVQINSKIDLGVNEYAEAQKTLKGMVESRPDLVKRLDQIALLAPGDPDIGEMLLMDAARKRVVTIYNGIERAKAIKATKQLKIEAIVANVDVLEDQILHSADMLNPMLIEQQKQFEKQYEEMLRQEKKDNAALEDVVDSFNASLATYLTDEKVINDVIRTNMAFNKLVQQEQEREEGRKIAMEELRKQKTEQTQKVAALNIN